MDDGPLQAPAPLAGKTTNYRGVIQLLGETSCRGSGSTVSVARASQLGPGRGRLGVGVLREEEDSQAAGVADGGGDTV